MERNWKHWLWIGTALVWTLLIVLGYWSHHPYYSVLFAQWPNAGLIAGLAIVNFGAWYGVTKLKWKTNGLMLYGFLIFLEALVYGVYCRNFNVFQDGVGAHMAYFLGFNILVHAGMLLIALAHYAVGDLILRPLSSRISAGSLPLLGLALGIAGMGFPMLALGFAGWIKPWVVGPLLMLPLAINYKQVMRALRSLFLMPHALPGKSGWATAPLFLMFVPMTINMVYALAPYPTGYDGAQLYMNTTHLIAAAGSLPVVGQAFNWELFMSLGEVLFGSVTISLFLSQMAILACMFAVYRLGRLFLARQWSWLAASLLYVTPAFSFHASIDSKVDLGFLFIALSTLLLLLELWRNSAKQPQQDETVRVGGIELPWQTMGWLIAGWLGGYLFGIKYTGLFGILALLAVHFNRWAGWRGTAGVLLTGIGALYMGGIDKFSYQDLGATPPWAIGLAALIPGLALLGWGMAHHRVSFGNYLRGPILFALAAFLSFSPWMGKHYQENRSLSVSKLIQGGKASPELGPPPSVSPEDRRKSVESRKVLDGFSSANVVLSPEQETAIRSMVKLLDFNTLTLAQRQTISEDLQARAVQEVLRDDQRLAWESIGRQDATLKAGDDARVAEIVETMTGIFARRGVILDETQAGQMRDKIQVMVESGKASADDREWLADAREQILGEVLTEDQRAQFPGIEERKKADGGPRESLSSAQREEIKRYIGYEPGALLFASLPFDLTMNTNVQFSRFLDITFLLLLLLPFLFLSGNLVRNGLVALLTVVLTVLSVLSLWKGLEIPAREDFDKEMIRMTGRHEGWLSELLVPLYKEMHWQLLVVGGMLKPLARFLGDWSFAAILAAILTLAGLAYAALRRKGDMVPDAKGLLVYTFAFGLLWFLFGNAIPWYGFGFFAGMMLVYAWVASEPAVLGGAALSPFIRRWWGSALGLAMVLGALLPFVSAVQDQSNAKYIFQGPFLKFAGQKQTLDQTMFQFAPFMNETVKLVNSDLNKKVYRVGTFFQYHIKQNDLRVLEDNQLGVYATMTAGMEDKSEFIRLLKEKGFGYVLYDLNTMSIDLTPDRSLTRKSQEFFMTLARSPMVRAAYTDNFIKDPAVPYTDVGGIRIPGKPGIGGENTMQGRFVVFEIL